MNTDNRPDWKYPGLTEAERLAAQRAIWVPLWERGDSASQIADHFKNCSRNAIIGAVHRAKLSRPKKTRYALPRLDLRSQPPRQPKAPKPKAQKPVRRRYTPAPITKAPEVSADVAKQPELAWLLTNLREPIHGPPVSILGLPDRPGKVCRFLVVGGYCGHPSAEDGASSWCEEHERIVLNPEALARVLSRRKSHVAA